MVLRVKRVVIRQHLLQQCGDVQLIGAAALADIAVDAVFDLVHLGVPLAAHVGLVGRAAQQSAHSGRLGNVDAHGAGQAVSAAAAEVPRQLRPVPADDILQLRRHAGIPAVQLQPKERELRYDNIRSARAEEGILRLLIRDESLFPEEPPLREEQFSSPLLGRAFTTLWQAKAAGRVPSLAAQAEFFSQEEMNHLTGVCQQPESLRNGQQALADYIRIVQTEAEKRLGGGTADPLLAATEKYKDKKGTGGKQHGK